MIFVVLSILETLYLLMILKFEKLRPQIYHQINDEVFKKKWMKYKIISECLSDFSMIVFSIIYVLNKFISISYSVNILVLNIVCMALISSVIISILNNKKNAGRFSLF